MIITGLALYVNMKQAARGEAPFKRSEWTYDCSLTLFIKRIGVLHMNIGIAFTMCALFFNLIIVFAFFSKKRINTIENKIIII